MTLVEALPHMPCEVSDDIARFVTEDVFRNHRYLFLSSDRKRVWVHCTHCCGDSLAIGNMTHNNRAKCPICGVSCIVKDTRYKRSTMIDQAYFVWYEKSSIDPQVVVARGFVAVHDWRGDYRTVGTQYMLETFYVFRPGHCGAMFWDSGCWYPRWRDNNWHDSWNRNPREMSTVWSRMTYYQQKKWICNTECSPHNVQNALTGTPLQYVPLLYDYWSASPDMVKLLALACRYPCVEYLTKMGLDTLVSERLEQGGANNAVNWNGKTVMKVLRCGKQDIRVIREQFKSSGWTSIYLWLYQQTLKNNLRLTLDDISLVIRIFGHDKKTITKELLAQADVLKFIRYIGKQFLSPHYYGSIQTTRRDYQDYIRDCESLKMDCSIEAIRYPSDLHKAHQETIKRVKHLADESLNAKISELVKKLNLKYRYQNDKLLIRPAASSAELVKEGNALNHCVGGYAERYANGSTILLVIRRVKQPNRSFYTVEMGAPDIVRQCRGKENCKATPAIKNFLDEFVASLKPKAKTQTQDRETVPA